MIKVVHIITQLDIGGAQYNTLYTIDHLDQKRFRTELIAGAEGKLEHSGHFIKALIRPISPIKDLLALIIIFIILREERPDIVHTHSSKAGILGRIAAKLAGVPIIIHTVHGWSFNDYQKPWTRWLFIWLERICARFTTKIIVVSFSDARKGLKYLIGFPKSYHKIRSGVDIKAIKKLRRGHRRGIYWIGAFKPQKDPLAFVRLARELPQYKFFMIGDGELMPEVKKLKPENLILASWRTDVLEHLATAKLLVNTSKWEGLPRAVVEALILGVPVVAYDTDGIPEVVNDKNGLLTRQGNPDDLRCFIRILMEDFDRWKYLSDNARKSIGEEFDINYMVRQQEKLYEELMNEQMS